MPNRRSTLSAAQRALQIQQNEVQDNEDLQSAVERLGIRSIAPPIRVFRIRRHTISLAKGFGWFATVNIMRGTPLLAEKELFFAIGNYSEDMITAERDRLSPADQGKFDALACPGATSTPKEIFDTNAFEMHVTQQQEKKMGLFLDTARLNHSCKPNAYWTWNRLLSRLTVHAMVNIPMGDEITISYRPATNYHIRTQRDIAIRIYDFHCDCEACQPLLPFGAGSDARRRQMRRLHSKINRNNYLPGNMTQRLHDIGKLEHLLRQEGLIYPMLADMYHLVAEWYQATLLDDASRAASYEVGNRRVALEFARKELDLDVACTGHRSPEVAKTLTFIRRLKG